MILDSILAALLFASSAQAQEVVPSESTSHNKVAPVEATKLPTLKITEEEKPSVYQVRSEQIEEKQAKTIKEVLKDLPDVIVGGSQANAQKVYVRGLEDTQMNVTVDGARQAGYLFHHQGRLSLDTDLYKAVSLEAGTGDSLSGPGSLAGTMRFTTKDAFDFLKPSESFAGLGKLRYATNAEEFGLSAGLASRLGSETGFLVYLNGSESKDYKGGDDTDVPLTSAKPRAALVKLSSFFAEIHKVHLTYSFNEDNATRSVRSHFGGGSAFNPESDQEFGNKMLALNYDYAPVSSWWDLHIEVNENTTELQNKRATGISKARSVSQGFLIQNTARGEWGVGSLGFDLNKDQATGKNATGSSYETGDILGVFAQWKKEIHPGLSLVLGGRFDQYKMTDIAKNEIEMDHVSPSAALDYSFLGNWKVSASWSQAFKGGTPAEALILGNAEGANPVGDLKGTVAETTEVSIERRMNFWQADLVIYRTILSDPISSSLDGSRMMTRTNVADMTSDGFNVGLGAFWENLKGKLSFARNKARSGDNPIGYVAFNKGNSFGDRWVLTLDYVLAPQNLTLNWTSVLMAELTDVPATAQPQPGYDVHDISANWTPSAKWKFGASVLNIFDKKYIAQGTPYMLGTRENTLYEPGRDLRVSGTYYF